MTRKISDSHDPPSENNISNNNMQDSTFVISYVKDPACAQCRMKFDRCKTDTFVSESKNGIGLFLGDMQARIDTKFTNNAARSLCSQMQRFENI